MLLDLRAAWLAAPEDVCPRRRKHDKNVDWWYDCERCEWRRSFRIFIHVPDLFTTQQLERHGRRAVERIHWFSAPTCRGRHALVGASRKSGVKGQQDEKCGAVVSCRQRCSQVAGESKLAERWQEEGRLMVEIAGPTQVGSG